MGIWTTAKAKKKALDRSPVWVAVRSSSRARSLAMTPMELRRNWLIA